MEQISLFVPSKNSKLLFLFSQIFHRSFMFSFKIFTLNWFPRYFQRFICVSLNLLSWMRILEIVCLKVECFCYASLHGEKSWWPWGIVRRNLRTPRDYFPKIKSEHSFTLLWRDRQKRERGGKERGWGGGVGRRANGRKRVKGREAERKREGEKERKPTYLRVKIWILKLAETLISL